MYIHTYVHTYIHAFICYFHHTSAVSVLTVTVLYLLWWLKKQGKMIWQVVFFNKICKFLNCRTELVELTYVWMLRWTECLRSCGAGRSLELSLIRHRHCATPIFCFTTTDAATRLWHFYQNAKRISKFEPCGANNTVYVELTPRRTRVTWSQSYVHQSQRQRCKNLQRKQ
jgi:hypothetical protein